MPIARPDASEYDKFYQGYVDGVTTEDVIEYLKAQKEDFVQFLEVLPADRYNYAYAAEKWTIKQLLRHIIDAERMFGYRAMSIARGEQAMLPGFDDQAYVTKSDDSQNSFQDLIKEFSTLRDSHIQMVSNLTIQATERVGNANGSRISVRAIIYIIAGHLAHHKQIITERYLPHV